MSTFGFPDPEFAGANAGVARALKRKREWEDDACDDLSLSQLAVSDRWSSEKSATSRRHKIWRQNRKASARSEARERQRPTFSHIRVSQGSHFYRHYQPKWKFADPDPLVREFIEDHGGMVPDVPLLDMCMMLPCDAAQMAHLAYFDRPATTTTHRGKRPYQEARKLVKRLLRVSVKLPFPHAEGLIDVPFKAKKYPGNEYREMGYMNRQDAHPAAVVDAELAWAQLLAGEYVAPHTVRLGGRGKLVAKARELVEAEGVPKGRLILMLSQRDLLLLGNVEKLLTSAYKDPAFPISIGMGWYCGNVTRFMERLIPLDKFFCMDAEKFDAALEPWLVEDALDILRDQFDDAWNPKYDAYWRFVLESLLSAPIARDDGWIMFKEVGTTSGHSFNTLLQSVCSLLVGYAALFHLTPESRWRGLWEAVEMETLGDDNITGVPDWLADVTAQTYGEAVLEMTGINWLGKKSFGTPFLEDPDGQLEGWEEKGRYNGVQYLGKFFRRQQLSVGTDGEEAIIPYRPLAETVARLYYPERGTNSVMRTYLRALGNLLDNYGNPRAADWLNRLLDWLEGQLDVLPTTWSADTVEDAARDYTGARVEVPRPRRWTYEEWLELTLQEREELEEVFLTL